MFSRDHRTHIVDGEQPRQPYAAGMHMPVAEDHDLAELDHPDPREVRRVAARLLGCGRRLRPRAHVNRGYEDNLPAQHGEPGRTQGTCSGSWEGGVMLGHSDFDRAVRERLMICFGLRPRGAADVSPVSACDCHLVPRPRPRDLPDPHCRRCLGSGEVACG